MFCHINLDCRDSISDLLVMQGGLFGDCIVNDDDRSRCSSGMNGMLRKASGGGRTGWRIGLLLRMGG